MRAFIDSDVIISALISSRGAAHFLLTQPSITHVISSISLLEIRKVVDRMSLDMRQLETLLKNIEVGSVTIKIPEIKNKYGQYVTDTNDAHIVAGAHILRTRYLISYNLRHFKTDKLKSKLDIVLLTPALFMQYLRSQS